MDHMMPEMDGIEATNIIRNEIGTDYAKNIPIIALTANALSGSEEMFIKNGFSSFLSKPIDIMILDVVLNQFVRNKDKESMFANENSNEKPQEKTHEEKNETPCDAKTKQKTLLSMTVDGIDIQAGINRYENEEIFLHILESYAVHTQELLTKLKNCVSENLYEYAITVHGLKSSSFGIFANDIGRKAEELETLSKAGNKEAVLEKHPAFIKSAENLVNALTAALKAANAAAPKKETREDIDSGVLEIILDAAKHFKTQILDEAVASLAKYEYAKTQDAELVAWIGEQAENLEYEAIQKRLESR
jgi:CheY-like chemotaxis protein